MRLGPVAWMLPDSDYRMGWIRVFGWGLSWTDHRRHPPVFSERQGIGLRLHIGPWCFKFLPRLGA